MAIYSCAVSTVGRSTHAPGTAGAHLRYIGRPDAASAIEAAHMPADPQDARTWMDGEEREARKNARLCTKIRLALPRELAHAQNAELVRDFLSGLTGGRVPAFWAIHDRGKDAHNPHAHLALIDRDIESGKRVLRLSDSPKDREKAGLVGNGVEWIRERWEHFANQALERAGHAVRVDRRSLEAQGVDRAPTIHVGPRASHIDRTVQRPESKIVSDPTPRRPDRVIDYPMIDAGRTRRERNAEIIDFNLEAAGRSPDFETRAFAQFEREQRAKDRPVEAQRVASARRRTLEERRLRDGFKKRLHDTRAKRNAEAGLARAWTTQRLAPKIVALKARPKDEKDQLQRQQGRLFARLITAIDITGATRRKREAAARVLETRHRSERAVLAADIRQTRTVQAEAVQARYKPEIEAIKLERRQKVAALKDRQREEAKDEDAVLQAREADREQGRVALKAQIDEWKKAERRAGKEETQSRKDPPPLTEAWHGRDERTRDQARQERAAEIRRIKERQHGQRSGPEHSR